VAKSDPVSCLQPIHDERVYPALAGRMVMVFAPLPVRLSLEGEVGPSAGIVYTTKSLDAPGLYTAPSHLIHITMSAYTRHWRAGWLWSSPPSPSASPSRARCVHPPGLYTPPKSLDAPGLYTAPSHLVCIVSGCRQPGGRSGTASVLHPNE
jgi:hypothetical protein